MRAPEARNLLQSEYNLAKDAEYWKHFGQDGLAVFLSEQVVKHFPLSEAFDELAIIGQRFNLRPLFSLPGGEQYMINER